MEARYTRSMTARPTVAFFDDRIVPFADARVPLEDRGLQFAESVYEVIAIAGGRPQRFVEHVHRMQRNAEALGIEAGVPDVTAFEALAVDLVRAEGWDEALLYAQVTGGSAPRAPVPRDRPRPRFWAYLNPYRYPRADDVLRGIRAITAADPRWARCDLKTTMLLPAVLARHEAARRGAHEVILLGPDGEVREGATSNVLLVEGRTLVTPAQTSHLLPGVTRPLIGELAREAGLEVSERSVSLDRLLAADEVFLSSTSQLVMPIVEVDGRPIGDGRGGPVAVDLARRLRAAWSIPEAL